MHFILALFGKNVLLTAKIKNTNLVALESAESLYHNFGLQINNKNVPIFSWNLTADDETLTPFFTSVFCRFCVNKVLLYAGSDHKLLQGHLNSRFPTFLNSNRYKCVYHVISTSHQISKLVLNICYDFFFISSKLKKMSFIGWSSFFHQKEMCVSQFWVVKRTH